MAGGMSRGHELKFWTPGGSSTPLFTAEHLDVPLDFDSVVKAGSMNGTRAVMIFDDSDSVVHAVLQVDRVLRARVLRQVHAVPRGHLLDGPDPGADLARRGHPADLDTLLDICDNILGRSFCALGDGATSPITSSLQYFREEYLALHRRHGSRRGLRRRAEPCRSRTDMTAARPRSPGTGQTPGRGRPGHRHHRRLRDLRCPRAP